MNRWSSEWDEKEKEQDNISSTKSNQNHPCSKGLRMLYFKMDYDNEEFISAKNAIPIDFFNAMEEIQKLPKNNKSMIGFKNNRNRDFIELHYLSKGVWMIDTGISDSTFDNNYCYSITNTQEILEILKLFFKGRPWSYLLHWKSMKINKRPTMEEIR